MTHPHKAPEAWVEVEEHYEHGQLVKRLINGIEDMSLDSIRLQNFHAVSIVQHMSREDFLSKYGEEELNQKGV